MLRRLLSDRLLVIQIAKHDVGTGRFDLFAMFLSSHEACHSVSFCNEQVQDIPANESWANNEDILSCRRHFEDDRTLFLVLSRSMGYEQVYIQCAL